MEKKKITRVRGGGFHLPGDNIDTDRIIPARFLKCVTFAGLGDHVFEDDRKQASGNHPFDNPHHKGCAVLVADGNFASGSSREHAVPALTQWGIQAIIAKSFSAIFSGNAVGNGLVCVTVSEEVHASIVQRLSEGPRVVSIDLETMHITVGSGSPLPCMMDQALRDSLMTGRWDDIAICLEAGDAIGDL